MTPTIQFHHVSFRKFQYEVFRDTDWEMLPGESWAVTGSNGSGKTTFLEAIEGRLMHTQGIVNYHFADETGHTLSDTPNHIASVYFDDKSLPYGDFYYQQRYNASDTKGIITVCNFLKLEPGNSLPEFAALGVDQLLDMEIIKLSNGQFKKMLIIKALLKKPRLLLLDNLFVGLDAIARDYVTQIIDRIIVMGTQIVMTCDAMIPPAMTNVMELEHFAVKRTTIRHDYVTHLHPVTFPYVPFLPKAPENSSATVVRLTDVNVVYGGQRILDRINWTVQRGEKWGLMGPNGAGKSMLLSLIFADNPQAYANQIELFGRKRGTGESIWDIKERIGYVSPESHLYFRNNKTCREVAFGGIFENPYSHPILTDKIRETVDALFRYYSIAAIDSQLFSRVSTSQQNMVLLIRALVKNPELLILDEPFQGFDERTVALSRRLLDIFCRDRALIFVSHNPQEIPQNVDHWLFLKQGRQVDQL